MTSKLIKMSASTRTALFWFVVGFLAAIFVVEAGSLVSEWLTSNRFYVEGDPVKLVETHFQFARSPHHHHNGSWEMKFQQLQDDTAHDYIGAARKNDEKLASLLLDSIKVVCCVLTSSESLYLRSAAIRSTWGRRCSRLIFVTDTDDRAIIDGEPSVFVGISSQSRLVSAFDHLYRNHINDYDWFLQVDAETYVIMENLRYLISALSSNDSVHFRHHFSAIAQRGYLRTGAGYLLSKETLMRFGSRTSSVCPSLADAIEDRSLSRCLRSLGSRTMDSRDVLGRTRFHFFPPEMHIHGMFPTWYESFNKNGKKHVSGVESISNYAISFHFVRQEQFYELEFYVYHLRPYGVISGLQHLNRVPQHRSRSDIHPPLKLIMH